MRILGLDVGDRTIGVAISDPLGWTAQGVKTIKRSNLKNDIKEIEDICNEYKVDKIVSGLPKNMNGTLGPQSEKVTEFCDILKKELEKEIIMWDERLTTVAAHKAMIEGDLSRAKRKKIVDKIAAIYILQGYLDSVYNK
ncbi:putative pre-16S rRNA nuclease [Clostridium tetani]|uniref:Putative pre-16S rRNA nuclease n=2 Tax=Clostridium tetani TaxID=1513 RepID=YQGF_CLOTE|nr:Holliday junction resolvase RuvX [Clostridium tetani]Q896F1.1 RecName: Full=Putative pre-16S rRNA nuclease [Clostridium tetani E88]AAO35639.1 DNA integration/recombination protein [Clostridium tetani E88]AVP54476.1 Holliday junction resolvase RuvX [Clostridium tetani]KGI36960.1 Holliday junction resolvase [Clostridium tetani]KGI40352.1 Holliday junction resolvase [Clostridium tetani ATCC 9441]KGI42466.1 Holliday junction resolvase [Clostridium tetani]